MTLQEMKIQMMNYKYMSMMLAMNATVFEELTPQSNDKKILIGEVNALLKRICFEMDELKKIEDGMN